MNIIVTGVSGFIGAEIYNNLSSYHNVFGLYRNKYPIFCKGKNKILIQTNFKNLKNLPKKCDYIIHSASATPNNNNKQIYDTNISMMKTLLKYSIESKCKFFLFLSSMAVYGQNDEIIISEKSKMINPSEYGKSKLDSELLLKDTVSKNKLLKGLSIRLPGVVGKNSKDNFISKLFNKILNKETVYVHQKNAKFNNIVNVDEISELSKDWYLKQKKSYNVINIASYYPINLNSVAKIMSKELGVKVNIFENFDGKKPFIIDTLQAKKSGVKLSSTKLSLLRFIKQNKELMASKL